MKNLVLLSLFMLSANSYAATVSCIVKADSNPTRPESKVTIDLDARGVNTIDFLHDGKTDKTFARWPEVRGASEVSYCNPNDNEYRDYSQSYSMWSVCSSSEMPAGYVTFSASFTLKDGGKISFLRADKTEQTLEFADCK